jgi:hypothetical protein
MLFRSPGGNAPHASPRSRARIRPPLLWFPSGALLSQPANQLATNQQTTN